MYGYKSEVWTNDRESWCACTRKTDMYRKILKNIEKISVCTHDKTDIRRTIRINIQHFLHRLGKCCACEWSDIYTRNNAHLKRTFLFPASMLTRYMNVKEREYIAEVQGGRVLPRPSSLLLRPSLFLPPCPCIVPPSSIILRPSSDLVLPPHYFLPLTSSLVASSSSFLPAASWQASWRADN